MKVIILLKEPIVERIPNLKAFIVYAISNNCKVTLLTTKSKVYPEPTFLTNRIKYIAIKERTRTLQFPTFLRFYLLCTWFLMTRIFQRYALVLAGKYAIIFGHFIKTLRLKKFSSFIIEYPEFNIESNRTLNIADKFELKGIRESEFLITHDNLHAEFISERMNISNLNFITIPNGTIGKARKIESEFLHQRLKINKSKKLLLHSGGFGPWFESIQLSQQSERMDHEFDLIFHVSHNILIDDYYKDFLKIKKSSNRTLFSMEPVNTYALDGLISSAYIGIAWYSVDILGYRAAMLGLAAGKIGNYLKCGIPVIIPKFKSFDYITEFGCGVQISDLDELHDAVSKIDKSYAQYSDNAIKCYNELWETEKHCNELLIKLRSII